MSIETDPSGEKLRYAAFISYSHADERDATRLQRWLESYRLPGNLVRAGSDGSSGKRIGAIFRDRADLAAASSLTDAIRAALAQSAALIVLCSPEAAASPWVDAEIRLFRECHPAAPVLAVVVHGEPQAAMPAALTEGGREPLAADMRKDADGVRLARLKIAAALARVPLDALIQRDAQRKLTRVMAITALGSIALLVMAAMTAFAINARNEARAQRQQAEGLIEYMLTDLRTSLRGVGRIDVMSAVNDRAFDYYRNAGDLAELSDDSLERRARVLQAMASDEIRRDNKAEAQALAQAAYRSTALLLERSPRNPDRIFAHAQSEYEVGSLAWANDNPQLYRRGMENYAVLAARLATIDPDRVRAQREVGYAQGNLCYIWLTFDTPSAAGGEAHCAASLAAQRRVLALRPTDRQAMVDVTNRLSWYGKHQQKIGDLDAAIASWSEAVALAQRIVTLDPINRDSQDLLAAVLFARGQGFVAAGNDRAAMADARAASDIVGRLREIDPSNGRWLRLSEEIDGLVDRADGG